MPPRLITLSSGLRIATDTMSDVAGVSLGFYTGVGSRHEHGTQGGISHLLEHMFFKGTASRDVRTLNRTIEGVGGYLGAYTARDQTAFYTRVLREDVPLALDLIADMMQHSRFDPADLAKEKDVVAQEIGEATDAPDDLVFDLLQGAAWPDQPLGAPILGRAESLANVTQQDLVTHVATYYRTGQCVLTAAGAVDHDDFVALVEKLFADLPAGNAPPPRPARYVGGEALADRDHQEQLHLCFGLPGVGFYDRDYFAQMLFAIALGGGTSSRLFHEVREERGLAYSVSASASPYADGGLVTIYAACDPERAHEAVPVILQETRTLGDALTDEELARAKALVRAGLLMEMESTSSRAERLANHLLIHNRLIPLEETLKSLAAVQRDDIRRFSARLRAGSLSRAAVGPLARLEPFAATAARLAA